jgi:hypothetical protein
MPTSAQLAKRISPIQPAASLTLSFLKQRKRSSSTVSSSHFFLIEDKRNVTHAPHNTLCKTIPTQAKMSFQTPSKQNQYTAAKSCTKSFTPGKAGVAFLFAAGCVMDQSNAAFTSSTVSSFSRSRTHRLPSSVNKMQAAHSYDGEEEMTGPFFFSGEPTVDDTSVHRLETMFQKPAPSSPLATATISPTVPIETSEPTTTTLNLEKPFFFSRDASMDERIVRLREIFENEATEGDSEQEMDSWQ